jgi:hypothetical protein
MMLGGVGFQAGLDHARAQARREASAAAPAPTAARAPAPSLSVAEQLRDLKALLDDGALTPAEFAAAKQKVLDG